MKYCLLVRKDENSIMIAERIRKNIKYSYDEENPDIVIAVGGDGTILQAFHKYENSVVFGLHTGHLGFFANYNPDTVDNLIQDINNNLYQTEEIELLSCRIEEDNGNVIYGNALNEVTILSATKTLILDVQVDDEYFETFRGTGLCISTSSGSTAYNKSLHGAVVDHSLVCMQLTEIASINSNAYRTLGAPLLLSRKRRITLDCDSPLELSISIDHLSYTFKSFKKVEFYYNNRFIKMGYHNPEGFIKRIARTFIDSEK
jgi:NAD+ kinase